MFFSQTPGRRPPYITGLRVNSVTLGWVGAPNEHAPLRVHDAIAVFAARCLTRTRIVDQGLGGFHEHCAGFARAIKFRVSCPGEFKICRCGTGLWVGGSVRSCGVLLWCVHTDSWVIIFSFFFSPAIPAPRWHSSAYH